MEFLIPDFSSPEKEAILIYYINTWLNHTCIPSFVI